MGAALRGRDLRARAPGRGGGGGAGRGGGGAPRRIDAISARLQIGIAGESRLQRFQLAARFVEQLLRDVEVHFADFLERQLVEFIRETFDAEERLLGDRSRCRRFFEERLRLRLRLGREPLLGNGSRLL